jgi:hypothetical protein
VIHLDAALLHQDLRAELPGRADAPAAILDRLALLGERNQALDVIGGKVLGRHQHDRGGADAADRREILDRIVSQLWIDRGRQHMRGHAADGDGVAVVRRRRDHLRAERAGRTRVVLDIDALPERLAHPIREQPADHIAAAASRGRKQHPDLVGGVGGGILGPDGQRRRQQCEKRKRDGAQHHDGFP